jgi:heterodisulfide reductase subunit A
LDVLKDVLAELGIDPGRVRTAWVAASEAGKFAGEVSRFVEDLEKMGTIGSELD